MLGAINPTTAAVAHSAAAAAAAHGGAAAHAAGMSTVMLVLAGLGPLGGAIYVLLRQIYHRMEPYILKSDGEASTKVSSSGELGKCRGSGMACHCSGGCLLTGGEQCECCRPGEERSRDVAHGVGPRVSAASLSQWRV